MRAETVDKRFHYYEQIWKDDLKARGWRKDETWLALRFEKNKKNDARLVEISFNPKVSSGFPTLNENVEHWTAGLKSVAIYLLVAASRQDSHRKRERKG